MAGREFKNSPYLFGWIIAATAGLVAFGVSIVVGEFTFMPSAFFAAVITGVVGLILGMPWGEGSKPLAASAASAHQGHDAEAAPVAAAAMPAAAPKAEAVAPASLGLMSAPVVGSASASEAAAAPSEPAAAVMAEAPAPAASKTKAKAKTAAPKAKAAPAAAEKAAKAPAKAKAAAKPKAAKAAKADGPERLTAPRGGKADDLKEIEGIGPALEKLCHSLGFYHFDQIASWSEADIAWVDANMKNFKGRIVRDKWVAQAKLIVSEGLDAFRVRAKTNDY